MKDALIILALTWASLWWTPDQQGHALFEQGAYAAAAAAFEDPMWQGAAWYRAGNFKQAVASFSRRETAEAFFNKGNALVMMGNYHAAARAYGEALEKQPDWKAAKENLELAKARAKLTEAKGGDLGEQQEGADQVIFDRDQKKGEGEDTEVAGEKAMNQAQMQALWLRRIKTNPADFLKAKFAYQLQTGGEEESK